MFDISIHYVHGKYIFIMSFFLCVLNLYPSLFSKNLIISFLAGTPVDSITMTDCDQMTLCDTLLVNTSVIAQKEEKIKGSEYTKSCFSLVKS